MILEEIIVADSVAIILCIILLISRIMTRRYTKAEDRVFTGLLIIGIVCPFLEALSFIVDGKGGPGLRIINIIANSALYASTASVSILWIWYVDIHLNRDVKKLKPLYFPMFIIFLALVISLIPNAFLGFHFSVDANNVYSRALPGYLFYAFLMSSFVISVIVYIRFLMKHGNATFFPIWMFLTPVLAGVIIQAFWYGISLAWLGCAVGLVGIHINIQSKFSLVDGLTGLFNRSYIEHKLINARSSNKYAYGGIMLDIDYFKKVNDTFGHSSGDHALMDAASILLDAVDRDSIPFRFAGDEFIIITRVPIAEKDQLESKMIKLEEEINKVTIKYNARSSVPYHIIFSMGHAVFDASQADDVFFRNMDEQMYKQKQEHHSRRGI